MMAWVFYLPDKQKTWECPNILYFHILFCTFSVTPTDIINIKVVLIINNLIRILSRVCFLSEANSNNDFGKSVLILTVCRQSRVSQTFTHGIESPLSHKHRDKTRRCGGGTGTTPNSVGRTHLMGNQIARDT